MTQLTDLLDELISTVRREDDAEASSARDRVISFFSDGAKQIDELKGALIEQTVRADDAQASESIAQLAMERLRAYAGPLSEAATYARSLIGDWVQGVEPRADLMMKAWGLLDAALAKDHPIPQPNPPTGLGDKPECHETCQHGRPDGTPCDQCDEETGRLDAEQERTAAEIREHALRHQSGKKPVLLACPFCKEDGYSPVGLHLHFVNDWCPEYGEVMDAAETEAFGVERHQVFRKEGDRIVVAPGALREWPHIAAILAGTVAGDFRDWPKVRAELLDFIRVHQCGDSQFVAGKKS